MKNWKKFTSKALCAVLCAALLMSFVPVSLPMVKAEAAEETTQDSGNGIIVSFGDSFSSGEGIPPFYGQKYDNGKDKDVKEKVKSQDWLAHRSTLSWPGRLVLNNVTMSSSRYGQHSNPTWYFAASSGAETVHLYNGQEKKYDKETGILSFDAEGVDYITEQLAMLNNVKDADGNVINPEYITMTMGGNDAGFAGIVMDAVLSSATSTLLDLAKKGADFFDNQHISNLCMQSSLLNINNFQRKINTVWDNYYNGSDDLRKCEKLNDKKKENGYKEVSIRDRLRYAYQQIAEKTDNESKIIIAGYPKLFYSKVDNAIISNEIATIVNDSVVRFNDEIQMLVNQLKTQNIKICFVSVEESFGDNGAYAPKETAKINEINLFPESEDLDDTAVSSSYSMHPNNKGAAAYAAAVQTKINNIETYGEAYEWPKNSGSSERDIVLVLDASGSMSGEPMEQTKKASLNFVNTILKEEASIGIVSYDNEAMRLSNFNKNPAYLSDIINNINSGSNTNIDAGLQEAEAMLDASSAKKKIIVLMSDGLPNEGREGDDLIAYAKQLKEKGILIYTLGFFHKVYNRSSVQSLMQAIASDGLHYEVDDANNLVLFFGDVADQIQGTKYIYIRIACPVDVKVSHNGETLSSAGAETSQRTSFGTLTFEENSEEESSNNNSYYNGYFYDSYGNNNEDDSDTRIKILRLKEGEEYDVLIEGNGIGSMDYTISFADGQGGYNDTRRFYNIPISYNTVIETVAERADTTTLEVDSDGDGDVDVVYEAEENGNGVIVETSVMLYVGIGLGVVVVLIVIVIIVYKKKKKRLATTDTAQ